MDLADAAQRFKAASQAAEEADTDLGRAQAGSDPHAVRAALVAQVAARRACLEAHDHLSASTGRLVAAQVTRELLAVDRRVLERLLDEAESELRRLG